MKAETRFVAKFTTIAVAPAVAMAVLVTILPVPGVLVGPMICATGWVSSRVLSRHYERRLSAGDSK